MNDPSDKGAVAYDPDDWECLELDEVKSMLDPVGKPWWVAGGIALELFLGKMTRPHHDVDVAILRKDQLEFQRHLSDWELWIPTGEWAGEPEKSFALFLPWKPGERQLDTSQAWCKRSPNESWAFELLFCSGNETSWKFKRDESIELPLSDVGLTSNDGIPYLKPEVVLLHKAVSRWQGDYAETDFERTLPHLDGQQRSWLKTNLTKVKPDHAWIAKL